MFEEVRRAPILYAFAPGLHAGARELRLALREGRLVQEHLDVRVVLQRGRGTLRADAAVRDIETWSWKTLTSTRACLLDAQRSAE